VERFEAALKAVLGESVARGAQLYLTCKADSLYVSDAAAPGQTVGGKGLCLALFGVYLGKQPVSQVSLTRARRPRSGHVHTVAPRAVRFGSLVGPASAAQLERFEAAHLMRRSARLSWDVEMRREGCPAAVRVVDRLPSPRFVLRARHPVPQAVKDGFEAGFAALAA